MSTGSFHPRLLLAAGDGDTLEVVRQYLESSGALVSAALRLEDIARGAMAAQAVVLFADDYPLEHSFRAIADPALRVVVVVTANVSAFEWFRERSGSGARVIVLPRPAWGWMLLDAVREGVLGGTSEER